MKIIKFKEKKKYKYNRKVNIKNLVLKISIGLHDFEKKKKQRVRFNIDITTDSNIKPDNKNLLSIVNYEESIKKIVSHQFPQTMQQIQLTQKRKIPGKDILTPAKQLTFF